ncbi:MAG: glycosyltransferase family protein [Caulobacteraceae bacterium]
MKILLLGKRASITRWLEACASAWRADGHEVRVEAWRDPRIHPAVERVLLNERLGAPLAAAIVRRTRRFAPELIVAIGAYHFPATVLEPLAALPGRPPMIGWVGDRFGAEAAGAAGLFDAMAYTDSALLALHRRLGWRSGALYLPHAVDPGAAGAGLVSALRDQRMVFIANPTVGRRRIVAALASPISIHGPGWKPVPGVDHQIDRRRVRPGALLPLYRAHLAALNVRNEHNVLAGLNQRNFDPYLVETPVLSDAQGDLERCFDPGREVLVWRDVDELEALYGGLRADPGRAAAVGAQGRRRVLADHTYARRLQAIVNLV